MVHEKWGTMLILHVSSLVSMETDAGLTISAQTRVPKSGNLLQMCTSIVKQQVFRTLLGPLWYLQYFILNQIENKHTPDGARHKIRVIVLQLGFLKLGFNLYLLVIWYSLESIDMNTEELNSSEIWIYCKTLPILLFNLHICIYLVPF